MSKIADSFLYRFSLVIVSKKLSDLYVNLLDLFHLVISFIFHSVNLRVWERISQRKKQYRKWLDSIPLPPTNIHLIMWKWRKQKRFFSTTRKWLSKLSLKWNGMKPWRMSWILLCMVEKMKYFHAEISHKAFALVTLWKNISLVIFCD